MFTTPMFTCSRWQGLPWHTYLDSNCIVWCTCCVVFTLCALKLHIHPVDDCSFPFIFLFSFLFSCFSIIWGIFCMTMQGGPGSTPAQLRMVVGPHISSCKLRPGTSILHNCWEHGVCLLQFFFFLSFFSCFSIIWGIFCMTMQGGPGPW